MSYKNIISYIGHPSCLLAATILAFWIKFNIVLFTFKPYTATKLFFPVFFLIMLCHVISNWKLKDLKQARIGLLIFFAIAFFVPFGYLTHPHDWKIYMKLGLSLFSFVSLYFSVVLLNNKQKSILFYACYVFCLIALFYFFLQYFFGISYEPGHFRHTILRGRAFGILDDPDHSSGIYLLGIYFSLGIGLLRKRLLAFIPIAALFIFASIKSGSGGAWTGLFSSLVFLSTSIVFMIIFRSPKKTIISTYFFLWWAALFPVLYIFRWTYNHNFMNAYVFFNSLKSDSTIKHRLDMMTMAENIFQKHPFVGTGFANDFNPVIQRMYHTSDMRFDQLDHIHTTILSALATTGILGFISLVLLILFTIIQFARIYAKQNTMNNKSFVLVVFAMFYAIQTLSYSLQYLYSISYWFTLALPFIILFTSQNRDGLKKN